MSDDAATKLANEAAALMRFTELRLKAADLLSQAAKLPHLPDITRAHATAAAGLAGITLHRIIGEADEHDADGVRSDLVALCRIVDPLVLAAGEQLHGRSSYSVDLDLFRDPLTKSLDGDAMFECEQVGRTAIEEREDAEMFGPEREREEV